MANFSCYRNTERNMLFAVNVATVRSAAVMAAALFAVVPAGVAQADFCGGFGPGIVGPGNCYPPYNNNNGGDTSEGTGTWPPGADFSTGGDGNASGPPIVTPAATP